MQLTLKQACDIKGWTFAELARRANVPRSTITRLEAGRTRPLHDTVLLLEEVLGLKRGTLVFGQSSRSQVA